MTNRLQILYIILSKFYTLRNGVFIFFSLLFKKLNLRICYLAGCRIQGSDLLFLRNLPTAIAVSAQECKQKEKKI
jgi:hypothetical protein